MSDTLMMSDVLFEKVDSIPPSKKKISKTSRYDSLLIGLQDLHVGSIVRINTGSRKASAVYNAIWNLMRKRKIKNLQMCIRGNHLYCEVLYKKENK